MSINKNQLITAHRGLSGYFPENTQIAFDVALAAGFDGIEFDVHLTKDKQLVICHDETVDRTSDMSGEIEKMTLQELRKANFAANHEYKWIPNQAIMTLDEILIRYKNKFKFINIELKTDIVRYSGIEKLAVKTIKKHKAENNVLISCFNFDSLEIVHKLNPNIRLGFLWENDEQWKRVDKEKIKNICTFLHPSFNLYLKNPSLYDVLGLQYSFWTVRDRDTHERMKQINNVYSQISNFMF